MWRWLVSVVLVVVTTGCPAPERPVAPIPPVSTGKVRVRVFTEPAAVRIVTSLGSAMFVATDNNLERWDAQGHTEALLGDVVPGSRVIALAPDDARNSIWILTDEGLGSYDGEFTALPAPPAIDLAGANLAPAVEDGVWVGTSHGLWAVGAAGWTATALKDPVRALVRDREGWLWIATHGGMMARKPNGDVVHVSAAEGCAIAEPRLLVELPDARMLAIGADEQGHERIAVGKQLAWVTYRALPEVHWDGAVRRGQGAVVMGGGRVYRIGPADASTVRPLARDGMRLVALTNANGPDGRDWSIEPIDLVLPAGTTTFATVDDALLVGTRELGIARYRETDVHPHDWLRRRQMFQDATTLTVACARQLDCWIATGARQAWHWTGDRFVPGGPEHDVLAVLRDRAGAIYALHREDDDPTTIYISRADGAAWTTSTKVALTTPGDRAEISFARFASTGLLWVGLRYWEGGDVRNAYGIAIVDVAAGKVTYHRWEDVHDAKAWQLPPGMVDADVRGSAAWFATSEGAARLQNGQLKTWTAAEGLRAGTARAVTITADGKVILATNTGAGVWDGKTWEFPAALRFEINDVVATRNAQVWMATERGIVAWDGHKIRRIDTLRGLAENEVLDVAADQFDRVWARGPNSLTVVSQ